MCADESSLSTRYPVRAFPARFPFHAARHQRTAMTRYRTTAYARRTALRPTCKLSPLLYQRSLQRRGDAVARELSTLVTKALQFDRTVDFGLIGNGCNGRLHGRGCLGPMHRARRGRLMTQWRPPWPLEPRRMQRQFGVIAVRAANQLPCRARRWPSARNVASSNDLRALVKPDCHSLSARYDVVRPCDAGREIRAWPRTTAKAEDYGHRGSATRTALRVLKPSWVPAIASPLYLFPGLVAGEHGQLIGIHDRAGRRIAIRRKSGLPGVSKVCDRGATVAAKRVAAEGLRSRTRWRNPGRERRRVGSGHAGRLRQSATHGAQEFAGTRLPVPAGPRG